MQLHFVTYSSTHIHAEDIQAQQRYQLTNGCGDLFNNPNDSNSLGSVEQGSSMHDLNPNWLFNSSSAPQPPEIDFGIVSGHSMNPPPALSHPFAMQDDLDDHLQFTPSGYPVNNARAPRSFNPAGYTGHIGLTRLVQQQETLDTTRSHHNTSLPLETQVASDG